MRAAMFAFVDETGNTGENIFDADQPNFITAALITRSDFDIIYGDRLKSLAKKIGTESLHANRIGLQKIEHIAGDIRSLLRKADARFSFSRIEKNYLLVTKVVDYVFDSGENLAVPWQAYNLRFLRMLLVFKVAHLIDLQLAEKFWAALMSPKQADGKGFFVEACKELLLRVPGIPDARSREIMTDALSWAIENPDELTIHSNDKKARYMHLPNVVGFINLIEGIEQWSETLGRPVRRIKHDRQSQFEANFKFAHDLFTNASDEPYEWPGEEPRVLRMVFGSELTISSSAESAGIQIADLILWLFKKITSGDAVGSKTAQLFDFIVGRARWHNFSFGGAEQVMAELDAKVPQLHEFDDETRARAKRMQDEEKSRRLARLEEYKQNKLTRS
jgi:hypothetical protein